MDSRQERFEKETLLECELNSSQNEDGVERKMSIEEMACKPLSDILLDKKRNLTADEKSDMQIIVWYKLSSLDEEERMLAFKYFVEGKTEKEISDECKFLIKSNSSKDKGKYKKIDQPRVSRKLKKIKEKLRISL